MILNQFNCLGIVVIKYNVLKMIKKTLFFCWSMLLFVSGYSQQYSGTVVYKVMLTQDADYKPTDALSKEIKERRFASLAKQRFLLEFNNSQSRFIRSNSLALDESRKEQLYDQMASSRYSSSYEYYLDNKLKTGMFRYNTRGMLVKQGVKDKDWVISTESKIIGDYLCYKAVYYRSYLNAKGIDKTVPVIAWFAPSLPYRYGPKQYCGLPGLILELHEAASTFLATDIKIEKEKQIKIEFPKGKVITEKEYREYESSFINKS